MVPLLRDTRVVNQEWAANKCVTPANACCFISSAPQASWLFKKQRGESCIKNVRCSDSASYFANPQICLKHEGGSRSCPPRPIPFSGPRAAWTCNPERCAASCCSSTNRCRSAACPKDLRPWNPGKHVFQGFALGAVLRMFYNLGPPMDSIAKNSPQKERLLQLILFLALTLV